jgi:hypothetical protein
VSICKVQVKGSDKFWVLIDDLPDIIRSESFGTKATLDFRQNLGMVTDLRI